METLEYSDLEDNKKYDKALTLISKVKFEYKTGKHYSFLVESGDNTHSVMFFEEKPKEERWQCDCKWHALHKGICSHIIAVNLALKQHVIET